MSRLKTIAIAALGVTAVAAPTAAIGANNELRGAPQLRLVDGNEAQLRFTTDHRLARTESGRPKITITVSGGHRVSKIQAAGRHGNDYRYTARVTAAEDLKVGTKYTVRFAIPGQSAVTRIVKVHPGQR